MRGWMA